MFTNSAAAKITNQLISVQELFTSEFENPLKEKIKQVFDDSFDIKLEKAIEKNIGKLKGEKGDCGEKGETGLPGKDGLNGKDGKDGVNGKDGLNGKDGTNGANGLDGKDGKDGKNGLDGKDGLNGKDGINGKDAEFDYEFVKKELASLFEEWKANLGDLKGEQGKQGEKGDKGLDGAEYPTYTKQVMTPDLTLIANHKLPMTNGKAIVSIIGVSNLGAFIDLEENVIFQNLGGESKLLSKGRFNGVPSNSANLGYEINIVNGFLNVLVAGKTNEIFDVKAIIK